MTYESDTERELLRRVNSVEDFFGSILLKDSLQDWGLAKEFGQFLTRLMPDSALGHLVVARACRHLGDLNAVAAALDRCRAAIASGKMTGPEVELLLPIVEHEERL